MWEAIRGVGNRLFKRPPINEVSPPSNELNIYFGRSIDKAEQDLRLEDIKKHPEVYTVAEYAKVKLLLISSENKTPKETALNFFIGSTHEGGDSTEPAGFLRIQLFPDQRRVHFDYINIFDGEQPHVVSQGNFRKQQLGVDTLMAFIKYLNQPYPEEGTAPPFNPPVIAGPDFSMKGWTIDLLALNAGFNEKMGAICNMTGPDDWDQMVGTVPSVNEAEERLAAYYAIRQSKQRLEAA